MSIGKSRNSDIDINSLMSEIDNEHQVNAVSADIDKRLAELRSVQTDLQKASESLKQATIVLNKAVVALNSANASADNIVSGICKAIVASQENITCKVQIEQKDMDQITELSQAILKNVEILMKQHMNSQLHNMNVHESQISDILRKNEGIWFSNFWAKVTYITSFGSIIISLIIAKFG